AFLPGNTCYWQIRLEGAREVCFNHRFRGAPLFATDRRASTTTIWSDPALARPENRLTGVSFTRGGYSRTAFSVPAGSGGYEVHRPDHWLFDGTGLRRGDQLGAAAVVVGYECDGCDVALADGLPVATGADGTPRTFEILATAPATPFDRHTTPLPLAPGAEYELEFHARMLLGNDGPASWEARPRGPRGLGAVGGRGGGRTAGAHGGGLGAGGPRGAAAPAPRPRPPGPRLGPGAARRPATPLTDGPRWC